jgi:hypothetical protein
LNVIVVSPSEFLRAKECVGQVDQEPYGHDRAEQIFECHDSISEIGFDLQLLAGDGISDRAGEEGDDDDEKEYVEHC